MAETVETQNLKTFIRIRPPFQHELNGEIVSRVESCVSVEMSSSDNIVRSQFDHVFDMTATQQEVFDLIEPTLFSLLEGYNCTIFAYGQTGTGKTHTMFGKHNDEDFQEQDLDLPRECWGLIPRSVEFIFEKIGHNMDNSSVYCSYLQIYNEKIYDLLEDGRRRTPLVLRELEIGDEKLVYVQNLSEFRVNTLDEVFELLIKGSQNRVLRETMMNAASSRSHCILQLTVHMNQRGESGMETYRRAKLNMVDLAGSEKWNRDSDMSIIHEKELKSINQSLSALGNCISALTDKNRRHIPFRDSKLTRILQDSLGGNTKTTLIATLSPMLDAFHESVSTLKFADRAKRVLVKARINEVRDSAQLLNHARKEIEHLKSLLQSYSGGRAMILEQQLAKLKEENKILKMQLTPQQSSTNYTIDATGQSMPETILLRNNMKWGESEFVIEEEEPEMRHPKNITQLKQSHDQSLKQILNEPNNGVGIRNSRAHSDSKKFLSKDSNQESWAYRRERESRDWATDTGKVDEKGRWHPPTSGIPPYDARKDHFVKFRQRSKSQASERPGKSVQAHTKHKRTRSRSKSRSQNITHSHRIGSYASSNSYKDSQTHTGIFDLGQSSSKMELEERVAGEKTSTRVISGKFIAPIQPIDDSSRLSKPPPNPYTQPLPFHKPKFGQWSEKQLNHSTSFHKSESEKSIHKTTELPRIVSDVKGTKNVQSDSNSVLKQVNSNTKIQTMVSTIDDAFGEPSQSSKNIPFELNSKTLESNSSTPSRFVPSVDFQSNSLAHPQPPAESAKPRRQKTRSTRSPKGVANYGSWIYIMGRGASSITVKKLASVNSR